MNTRRATTMSSILVPVAAVVALLAAGCTGIGTPGATGTAGSSQPTEQQAAAAATVAAPAAATVVAPGRTPAEITAAVSRSLFTSSPAVVVAAVSDPDALSQGIAQSQRLGVPLLLADAAAGATTAAKTTSSAPPASVAPTDVPGASPLVTEVARLKPATVLALGPGVAAQLAQAGTSVVTDPAQLPAMARAEPLSDTAVLVSVGPGAVAKATAAAVTATAKAAGARAVPVAGADPRADTRAIEDLSTRKPAHVIAAGTAFGAPTLLTARLAVAATGVQLPGGGQVVLPGRRLVGM
jgi:hypothetical protein